MRKDLKELAFSAICLELSQSSSSGETIARWLDGFPIGISDLAHMSLCPVSSAGEARDHRRRRGRFEDS
jgi:hypothetical protein